MLRSKRPGKRKQPVERRETATGERGDMELFFQGGLLCLKAPAASPGDHRVTGPVVSPPNVLWSKMGAASWDRCTSPCRA